jgi:hypothetical protein
MDKVLERAPQTQKGNGAKSNKPTPWWFWPAVIFVLIAFVAFNSWLQSGKPQVNFSQEELSQMANTPLTEKTRRVFAEVLQRALREHNLGRASSEDDEDEEREENAFWVNLVDMLQQGGLNDIAANVAIIGYFCRQRNCPMVGDWIIALRLKKPSPIIIEWVVAEVETQCCPPETVPEMEEGGPGGDRRPTTGGERPGGGKGGRMKPPRPKLGPDGKPQ